MKTLAAAAIGGMAIMTGACTTMTRTPTDCVAQPARVLIGERASSETGAHALALTGSRTLRWGPPNSAWTMDYRQDRVNVRYDEAMMITEVTCG